MGLRHGAACDDHVGLGQRWRELASETGYQPNQDNNPQDYAAAPRLSATAATALILTIKCKKLQMTGAQPITHREPIP